MLGILLVDKPQGLTSHDVVNRVRRILSTKRVGHAGTLDPMATGLLVVAVGPATRFLQYLPLEPKVYEARIAFGQSSTTYDAEGELSESKPVPEDLLAAAKDKVGEFEGLIEQMPPMFSAIKIQGQPLYKYARMGKEIVRESRRVHIGRFELTQDDEPNVLRAEIECSGGTYIRSLAHDLGNAIGVGAHLVGLRRTRVGLFHVEDACTLDEVNESRLIQLSEALPPMPLVQIDEVQTQAIREGRSITVSEIPPNRLVALVESRGHVFSVARLEGKSLQPECVIPAEVFDGAL
ncbi:tRNA pseudouridine(55) synthase TruB [soil metagenome]